MLSYTPAIAQITPPDPIPEPPAAVEDIVPTADPDPNPPPPTPEETNSEPPSTGDASPPISDQTAPSKLPLETNIPAPEPQSTVPSDMTPQTGTPSVSPQPPAAIAGQTTQTEPPSSKIASDTLDSETVSQPEQDDPVIVATPQQSPEPTEQTTPTVSIAGQSIEENHLFLAAVLTLLLVGGIGLALWRKRKKAPSTDDEISENPQTELLTGEEPVSPIARETGEQDDKSNLPPKPTVKTKSPTIKKQKTSPPQPSDSLSQKQDEAGLIETVFTASHASSTLINAVVGYQVDINNVSSAPVTNVKVSGAMIQADHNIVESASSSQGMILQELETLSAGESKTVSGEIRHPLNSFSPIEYQSQKLLVPLVLLRFDYDDQDGKTHMQTSVYVIGTEYVPPRAKMAPFRLDQGPKNYKNVAHRPFQS